MTTLVVLAPIFLVAAQSVPTVMSYQGRLSENTLDEKPVDAKLPMTFSIYGSPTASDLKWTENWALVTATRDVSASAALGGNTDFVHCTAGYCPACRAHAVEAQLC